jgi:hypothetical protein
LVAFKSGALHPVSPATLGALLCPFLFAAFGGKIRAIITGWSLTHADWKISQFILSAFFGKYLKKMLFI